jgi:hypothetical protein
MADFDNDGLTDLAMANAGMTNAFFRQLPNHTFQDANALWGIQTDPRAHWGIVAADFDNDGDTDVYIPNGGFNFSESDQLLANDINTTGQFLDVSATAGDVNLTSKSFSATALDHDNDGLLDLFVTDTNPKLPSHFLHNLGSLKFVEIGAAIGLGARRLTRGSSSGDFDNDGWMDVAAGALKGANQLFRNLGNGTFSDVAAALGVASPDQNFGLILEDFNNDGWLDLFVPKYNQPSQGQPNRLYINNAAGGFFDVTAPANMPAAASMGHNTGDLDGDGLPEVLIGTGAPNSKDLDILYKVSMVAQTMLDLSVSSGITSFGLTRCHGMAIGDIDRDGYVDVYFNNGGPQTDSTTLEHNALWMNDGNDTTWIQVDLEGVVSNRSGIGAHLTATTDLGTVVHRYLRAGQGFCNTNSAMLHFGLNEATGVTQVDIDWPSGIHQVLVAPALSSFSHVVESGVIAASAPEGGLPRVRIVGPAGAEVALLLGADEAAPLPLTTLVLGEEGQAELSPEVLTILEGTDWRESGAWIQARIAGPTRVTVTPRITL